MKKLKSKHTGMIGELLITDKYYAVTTGNGTSHTETAIYTSLDKLNEDWEDYKEPKEYWYIDGGIMLDNVEDGTVKVMREIGNYFETEEEAEKAVEKLKAYKRLKDKGFRFDRWCNVSAGPYRPIWFYFEKDIALEDIKSDLDLLFGGEE